MFLLNCFSMKVQIYRMMFNISEDLVKTYPDFLRGKSYRDVAKNINFMALFGGSKYKLSKMLDIEIDEAEILLGKYFEATKQLQKYLNRCAEYGLKNGYIRTAKPYSGIRWYPNWKPKLDKYTDSKAIGEIIRNSFNTPIQASAAIITKLALVNIRKYIKENDLQDKVKLIHVVHDCTMTEVDEDYAEEFSKIQSDIMIEAGREFITLLDLLTDITISNCWDK